MLLRNLDRLIYILLSGKTQAIISYENKSLGPVRSNITSLSIADALGTYSGYYNSTSCVMFGTGITPPSYDDYRLSGTPISGLTVTASVTKEDFGTEMTAVYTINNTSGADVTIGEIGLKWTLYMLDRTVLETPLTIPAGSIGQLTYTIRMNYPVS